MQQWKIPVPISSLAVITKASYKKIGVSVISELENRTVEDPIPLPSTSQTVAPPGCGNDVVELSHNIIGEAPAQASTSTGVSFKQTLKTPQKPSSPRVTPRKKAVNSLAQALTKNIFPKKEDTNKVTKKSREMERTDRKQLKTDKGRAVEKKSSMESWYCFLCKEDRIADMRLCTKCARYVHEDYVGLTASNKDNFIYVRCED
nr:unnamed protein product [Callosobruchus analis]